MASHVAPLELLTERPMPVDADAIEEEFSRIWRESAAAGDESMAVRLRVLNFVGIARDARDAERFETVMQALPQRHPCRGIVALTDGSAGAASLGATIAAHCWRTGAGRIVCAEQVALTGQPGQEHALASAVLALLVPEMPVTAWLIGDPLRADDLVAEVLDSTDRLLFDSAGAADCAAALRHTAALCEEYDVVPGDLAWGRLTTWRALLAQAFDGNEGRRRLARIRKIQLDCAEARNSEPLLLAGWLMSRLRLSLEGAGSTDGGISARLRGRQGAIDLSLSPVVSPEGPLAEVRIAFDGDDTVSVRCHAERGHMHVEDAASGDPRTTQRLPDDDVSVISRALDDGSDAAVYREAAEGALALLDGATGG